MNKMKDTARRYGKILERKEKKFKKGEVYTTGTSSFPDSFLNFALPQPRPPLRHLHHVSH